MASPQDSTSFTGRRGRHQTRWTVKMADRVSAVVITVGGVATIAAVCLVFVLLLAVVLPMFRSASVQPTTLATTSAGDAQPLTLMVDEYRVLAWEVYPHGELRVFRVDTGATVQQERLVEAGVTIRDVSLINSDGDFVLARSDGQLQIGWLRFQPSFLEPAALPDEIRQLPPGQLATWNQGVVQVTAQQQYRQQKLTLEIGTPLEFAERPLACVHHSQLGNVITVAGLDDLGGMLFGKFRQRKNILTGETRWTGSVNPLPNSVSSPSAPEHLLVTGRGDNVLAIWRNGDLVRYDVHAAAEPSIAESVALFAERDDVRVTDVDLLLGRETLLVGDSQGQLNAWFLVRHSDAQTPDGRWLLPVHALPAGGSAVSDLGISQRSRMVAVGYAAGNAQVVHVTTESSVAVVDVAGSVPIEQVVLAPKDDGLFALAQGKLWGAEFQPAYPETSFESLFLPVWYEGYDQPEFIWQSSFAGVESEMKLSLMPLIFGTLKATVYSMLFGVPIALLAAIYTSEFLTPAYRHRIKPLIETMASLPSVVLGFLGGLVIAPIVERFVPTTICSFVTIPVCCLLGAFLWQQLPHRLVLQWSGFRLVGVAISLLSGFALAWRLGPWVEDRLFSGDMSLWLDQQRGTGTGAWLFLLLPGSGFVVALLFNMYVNSWLMECSRNWSRRRFAVVNLLKFLVGVVLAVSLAYVSGLLLTAIGWDPRGSIVGTYVQRNALVVGFVMGFAIIPIIYTISEDSLSTVPRHLRSASLGAGATQLQTTLRVVVPTAMSGLFSAVMIGLGRAVGETMIVLMAAGNTPVMDWNVFNGFRTLSANIAVELPEAVRDSTHYRTLFLAALTLLLLTFVINTVAELVRLRFRRRAVQL